MRYLRRRPTKEDVTREQIIADSKEVLKEISESSDNFAINYISRLLNTSPDIIKMVILRFFDAFSLFYLKGLKMDQKSAARIINRKVKHTPREYIALLLGLLKYSGAVKGEFRNIDKYTISKILTSHIVPPCWPVWNPKFKILKHASKLPIEFYPELIILVAEHDICEGQDLYRVTKLDILLSRLKRRNLESHEKHNKNAQFTKQRSEEIHVLRIKDSEI